MRSEPDPTAALTRRRALALGGLSAAGLVVARGLTPPRAAAAHHHALPAQKTQQAPQAEGTVPSGVLPANVLRNGPPVTGPGAIPFKPAFELDPELYFQPLPRGKALFNG